MYLPFIRDVAACCLIFQMGRVRKVFLAALDTVIVT